MPHLNFFFNRRRGGTRGRSRSRSRDRGDGFRGRKSEIDKEKLLAIAKKNAVRLLSSDNLMGMDHDRLIAIKSGGQNLRQLTDFCREIVAKGNFSLFRHKFTRVDKLFLALVFETENLRLTKKNHWPLPRKMPLGYLVLIT